MILVLKKKTVAIVASITAITIIAIAITIGLTNAMAIIISNKKLPIYYVESVDKKVALTFDAAWGADNTRPIMDILEKNGYKGNFFLTGFWVEKYPELVKEIHERGHLIANHSANHLHMNDLSNENMLLEMASVSDAISQIIGYRPKYFRAPYGEYNDAVITTAETAGMLSVQWNVDTLDWKGTAASRITDTVQSKAIDGSIILCHNEAEHIVEALPLIIVTLQNKGLTPVKLDQLILESNFKIEHDGKQVRLSD
ncbi:MAG: polysaccharide deacetylase family protein [Christensenellaceae bacterium]|jgi:peptidoglycan/xylan/chitin deacetylase (PgdA/CDA1 family)|nr:polysaccharide deacetylase family protein [Christensenellaceae bacterium]